jgi:hypothetical protein
MHPTTHERCDRRIDQAVALELRAATESLGNQLEAEVTSLARARVARVAGALVDDLEGEGCESALECASNFGCGYAWHGVKGGKRAHACADG